MALSRLDILNAEDLAPAPVEVPIRGGQVFVRKLTASEFVRLSQIDWEKDVDCFAKVVQLAVCDEKGVALFTMEDIPALSGKSFEMVKKLAEDVIRINGVGAEADDELGN